MVYAVKWNKHLKSLGLSEKTRVKNWLLSIQIKNYEK